MPEIRQRQNYGEIGPINISDYHPQTEQDYNKPFGRMRLARVGCSHVIAGNQKTNGIIAGVMLGMRVFESNK